MSLLFSLAVSAAPASVPPNAGQVMRDVESTRPSLPEPVELELELPGTRDRATAEEAEQGPRVRVNGFHIGGNLLFDSPRLLALLDDLRGRELSLAELNDAAGRIGAFYQAQGYALARAYLPRQEVEDGQVRIEVLEGRYGQIRLQNGSRTLDGVLRQPLARLESGAAVQGAELERSLLLLSDIPGVEAKGTLRPGQQAGTTDLLVETSAGPLVSGSVEADNYGDYTTGEYRLSGSLGLNSPLRLGDQLNLRLLGSDRHQRYYRAAYQLPVGPWSTRIGLARSEMRYRLGRDFSELDAHGRATIDSLFLAQPLLRGRSVNISALVQYENKTLRDNIGLFDFRGRKDIGLWTVGISGNSQDRLFGGGQNGFSLTYGHGRLRIGDPIDRYVDSRTAGKAGSFDKLNLSAMRLQQVSQRVQFFARLSAQWASGNLDSAEKIGLGGPYGVRAYPMGTARGSGDEGWQASVELRYSLAPGWQLSSFIDRGAVKFNKRPWTRERNHNHMAGTGVGATWYGSDHQVSLTAAWPLGKGEDNIKPERTPRLWLQATRSF
ncbi:ShlB/FhaC/HecB family hemolysin secretion/activation protein [Cupriavidus basilensis]|uniref:ShlB/FhaC/HecB family hemolysin secretion/activation protein n=1 Tax=Cupriavidus basilensis TaxID=68895 RepID=A0ABT6B477_9BURK|nr:ShlB/FhaC/HecB family hemolysin secretion/activation protein [Cupriavidus basilensis]MDF3839687.1 ShlB/FhaC/HecB family hemolysin secretion/activation protein [Cupriavidus basilensis]